ncbi:hypothetical protein F4781DRAFT_412229 [Annulohypoxylon bovei var. microspora]|nr:hypothetical protein F4781DRAFT_412229 [Annulohypoxylon bovei var. microspora]
MVYNSQGQNSLDPAPLTSSNTSSKSRSQTQTQPKSRKERNRKAAHKCRQKSKANIEQLEIRERELSEKNQRLKDMAYSLRNEMLCLKNEVLVHGTNCNNGPIQTYLARVVDGLVDKNPT